MWSLPRAAQIPGLRARVEKYHVRRHDDLACVTYTEGSSPMSGHGPAGDENLPVVVASILREEGSTGVHTHVRQVCRYLEASGTQTTIITPFSWGGMLTVPVFGLRLPLQRVSRPASVFWYRHWHEVFLYNALRRQLAGMDEAIIYAQGPEAAHAALRARRGPQQRIVMAVHYEISHANEWASKGHIELDGAMFRAIRRMESQVIPSVDGIVYVSQTARTEVLEWLPQAAAVPAAVIPNFIAETEGVSPDQRVGDLVTVGALEVAKNHRYLLDILAEVKRRGQSLTLDIYGIGPLRKDLERQASDLGIAEQVRFHGFRRDVRHFLPGYRAYVHTSYVESQSIAIMEGMAAGLPIVAAKIGGVPEICAEGVEARFWPLDDAGRAAEILLELLASPEAMAAASAASRRRFQREFDADLVGPRLRSFLLSATPRGRTLLDPEQLSA
jgi:glycosyltransferase involved in cell wall biosynthesis